jgi:hypothetical protein
MTPERLRELADATGWNRQDWIDTIKALRAYATLLEAKAPQEATGLQDKIARAYGYLWHVNNSGVGFQFSPEKAAHMARRVLRDTLTHEQRGNAINMAATELFEILRNEGNE